MLGVFFVGCYCPLWILASVVAVGFLVETAFSRLVGSRKEWIWARGKGQEGLWEKALGSPPEDSPQELEMWEERLLPKGCSRDKERVWRDREERVRGILGLYPRGGVPSEWGLGGRQAPLAGYHRMRSLSGESVTEGGKDSENRHPEFQPSVTLGLAVNTKDGNELEMKPTRVLSRAKPGLYPEAEAPGNKI